MCARARSQVGPLEESFEQESSVLVDILYRYVKTSERRIFSSFSGPRAVESCVRSILRARRSVFRSSTDPARNEARVEREGAGSHRVCVEENG